MMQSRDQDIAPRHRPYRTLVLQHEYKLLPPEDIVRLKASDELIVAIPAITNTTDNDVLLVLCKYNLLFQRIISKSHTRMNPDERAFYVEQVIVNDNKFRRDGLQYVEYLDGNGHVTAVVAVVVAVGGGICVPPIHPERLVKIRRGGDDMENIATIHPMEQERREGIFVDSQESLTREDRP
jgi:hypothetical protein